MSRHIPGGGASHLASIYGSEQDKVNCSFYLKIGACRHGERCSRKHIKPQFSQTLVIQNMYQNPTHVPGVALPGAPPVINPSNTGNALSEQETKEYFDQFYEDVYCELVKHGNLLEMHVCDNVGDHLIGNVYARYDWEDEASTAVDALNHRWYAGRPLFAELSPVTDFREACCRQNDMGECNRGGFCNFMHLRQPTSSLRRSLNRQQKKERIVNPDPKDEERKKEMEMFSGSGGTASRDNNDDDHREKRQRESSPRRY